jgi:hypothetical protein
MTRSWQLAGLRRGIIRAEILDARVVSKRKTQPSKTGEPIHPARAKITAVAENHTHFSFTVGGLTLNSQETLAFNQNSPFKTEIMPALEELAGRELSIQEAIDLLPGLQVSLALHTCRRGTRVAVHKIYAPVNRQLLETNMGESWERPTPAFSRGQSLFERLSSLFHTQPLSK